MSGKSLSGRPLYATAADASLYVPPDDILERVERSIARELNTLVLGEHGSGKTSLLQHLLFRAREAGRPAAYVDASIAKTPFDVVDLIREALGVPHHVGESVAAGLRAITKPGAISARESTELLSRVAPLREVEPSTVLLDGLASTDVAHTLFG